MAEVCVNLLLQKLQEEEKLLSSIRVDFERISDELQFMKTFLRVAESMEDSNFDLKLWLLKVIEIVYYMDDALDDFRLNLTRNNRYGIFASVRELFWCISTSKDRFRLSLKMQDMKSRVKDISMQHRRYCIKHEMIVESWSSGNAENLPRKGETYLLEKANPVGIQGHKQKLINWIVEGKSDRQVVSVVGVGGLGKSTLVKRVYDDAEVKKHFKFHAWITVSQFSTIEELLKDLIHQLFHVLHKADPLLVDRMSQSKSEVIRVANEFLQQKRYLIVLDNVWDAKVTDAFEQTLPDNNYGSRILLTAREATVASGTRSPVKVFTLTPLSAYDSWTLFSSKVFRSTICPPSLEALSNKILTRCEGLPLAIGAISGVLATKSKSRIEQWEKIDRSLGDNEKTMNVRKVLLLSYNFLPYYLKSCLLYLSLFPVGQPIRCSRLVRLWISEGFVNERGAMPLEQVAETYLNELIYRSLVQVTETTIDGRVKSCRIHDLVYEMLISKAKDLNFLMTVKNEGEIWLEKARRLSIHHSTPSIEQQIAPRLRSLIISGKIESPVFNLFLDRLRLLQVLDLEGTQLKEFPKQIVKLRLLKYLSLRKTKVELIPRSIGNLQNLETLDLKHACVTELPTEILKLQKLQHLLVYHYEISSEDKIHKKYGVKVPNDIGSLQSVQKLCFIEANDEGSKLMKELGKLNNLRRLGITKLRKENGKALSSSIEKLINLRALSITSMTEKETIDLDHICYPPQYLQRLYLAGNLERVPDWISSLDCLVKVVLKWSRLSSDPALSLQNLPKLVHLELIQAYEGTRLCLQRQGFRSLKFLGLNKLEELQVMEVEKGAMPHLEKLVIQSCYSMVSVPSGIEQLFELKVVEFINMPIELIMKVDPNTEHGDHWKVKHVPEVHFSYSNDGNWDVFSLNSSRKDTY
ncbi:disease resistance protein RPM1-like [Euphorbia lathyris]|uniref:disease resistance protein RPM1-like n=1 Tax=Euphorbia lathyris TaxID=212925 RepID=UPI003313C071